MEALKVTKANMTVNLHPSKTNTVPESVKQQLSSLLFKFNETFDGVLLAYEVVDVPTKHAKIMSGLYPYVGVKLTANLLLFSPKPFSFLEGKVVKLAKESIHIVVLGFSAAVITEDCIRDDFIFKIKNGEETYRSKSHKRHIIKVGTMVRFLVKNFDEEILHISGSLVPVNTGNISWLNAHLPSTPVTDRKRREINGRKDELSSGTVDGGAVSNDYHVLKKPKKQRAHQGS